MSIGDTLEELIAALKLNKARNFQQHKEYVCWASDKSKNYAGLPRDLNDILYAKTEAGYIYFGYVDIFNTSFVLICYGFNYDVGLEEADESDRLIEYVENIEIACEIDYDSIRQARYALNIDDFNHARHENQAMQLLDDILTKLRMDVDHA